MNEAEMTIPHLFRCPISLDLFEDPVTLCTGQTYDRSSIEKWLAQGNLTCPVTMQKLHDPSVVPNHTLRHLIDQWLQLYPQFDQFDNSKTVDSLASLKRTLQSQESTFQNKLQALENIRLLSDEYCSFNKSCFLQLGFLPLLLGLVFGAQMSREHHHMEFIELALSCIMKLLTLDSTSEPLNMLREEPKLESFLLLLEKGSPNVKTSLCNLIDSAAASHLEDVLVMLGKSQKLINEIVHLVSQNNCEASRAAIKAISALCSLQTNRENMVIAGAIDGIMRYVSGCETREKNLAPLGMEIIEKLLVIERGKEALVNSPNGIQTLVKMVFRVSNQECSENAVDLLMMVCRESGRAREEAIEGGVLTQLLLLLQSQCNAKTKAKARMLLKLLRSKWAEKVPKQA
ncbi:U-box domain-containing protein 26-like [Prosopis cineraria]|uniref:U-box domain-containing protein 26-like n=1 Tax=Prosopis cineraria TaxID=364024 RepID=UPI00240FBD03|nr:U-box domain-containing protein 26-like [Prosopis cineraria]